MSLKESLAADLEKIRNVLHQVEEKISEEFHALLQEGHDALDSVITKVDHHETAASSPPTGTAAKSGE